VSRVDKLCADSQHHWSFSPSGAFWRSRSNGHQLTCLAVQHLCPTARGHHPAGLLRCDLVLHCSTRQWTAVAPCIARDKTPIHTIRVHTIQSQRHQSGEHLCILCDANNISETTRFSVRVFRKKRERMLHRQDSYVSCSDCPLQLILHWKPHTVFYFPAH
jgi:hypothetical protein